MFYINRLKELMSKRKIDQKALSDMIGYSEAGLSKALKKADPKASLLTKIANALGVNESYFFMEEDEKKDNLIIQKYNCLDKSELNEPVVYYSQKELLEYRNLMLSKMNKIIELLEKRQY